MKYAENLFGHHEYRLFPGAIRLLEKMDDDLMEKFDVLCKLECEISWATEQVDMLDRSATEIVVDSDNWERVKSWFNWDEELNNLLVYCPVEARVGIGENLERTIKVDDGFLKDLANIGCIEYFPSSSFKNIGISPEKAHYIAVGKVHNSKSVLYVGSQWKIGAILPLGQAKWTKDGRELFYLWWDLEHHHDIESSVEVKDYLDTIQKYLLSNSTKWDLNVHKITWACCVG